mmetsp:Transcript_23167/g.17581  ORF Transcript_23167/g.17581 Transcript_23167/m.17581 type:complete len:193 (+) Transcript_23167:923-1501(+)
MNSVSDGYSIKFACKVNAFTEGTYGKFPNEDVDEQQMMELGHFMKTLERYLPDFQNRKDFRGFLLDETRVSLDEYADTILMTLPEPRIQYYQNPNYDQIQQAVTSYASGIVEKLGFFPVSISLKVLDEMEDLSQAVMFMSLIFDIIILLFAIISILLIYSLLMISVESKSFEIGVMRMMGLSKGGLMFMIVI